MYLRHGVRRFGQTRYQLTFLVLGAILCLWQAAPVGAQSPKLPAIVEPASQERHVGKMIFVELVTPDIEATKKFYGGVFGWTFQDIQASKGQYAEALLDGRPVAVLFQRALPSNGNRQPAWLSFFSVNDIDAADKAAQQRGGQVLYGPRDLPDLGREAILSDPQGAVFGILASSSGDPPDFLAEPGEWIWNSLITSNPDTAAAFYQTLFDFDVFELPAKPNTQHLLLASHNYARASVNSLPSNAPSVQPYWLSYVRVEDTAKTVAKVQALGGRVLVEPWVDRNGGKAAVVADQLGAPFGLLEWTASDTKKVSQ